MNPKLIENSNIMIGLIQDNLANFLQSLQTCPSVSELTQTGSY